MNRRGFFEIVSALPVLGWFGRKFFEPKPKPTGEVFFSHPDLKFTISEDPNWKAAWSPDFPFWHGEYPVYEIKLPGWKKVYIDPDLKEKP